MAWILRAAASSSGVGAGFSQLLWDFSSLLSEGMVEWVTSTRLDVLPVINFKRKKINTKQQESDFKCKTFMMKISLLKFCFYHKLEKIYSIIIQSQNVSYFANYKHQIIFLLMNSYCRTFLKVTSPIAISKCSSKHEPRGFHTPKPDSVHSLKELHKILSISVSQSDIFIK